LEHIRSKPLETKRRPKAALWRYRNFTGESLVYLGALSGGDQQNLNARHAVR
jgi:hypothetical protein